MIRLILRLRPSAGLPCQRALQARPSALGCRFVPGTGCPRRFHCGAASRAVSLSSGFRHRATLLRCPQLASGCQTKRFYSLPPHQKVTVPDRASCCYSTDFIASMTSLASRRQKVLGLSQSCHATRG